MKKKKINQNIPLALFFAFLLIYLVILSLVTSEQEAKGKILIPISLADITSFSIHNDRLQTTIRREGNIWRADNIPQLKLSKQDIDTFLEEIRTIQYKREIENQTDLLPFGLAQSNNLISLSTTKNKWTIILGNPTSSGKENYVKVNGRIHIIPSKYKDLFTKDLFTFRAKEFFNFNTDHISRIDISHNGKRIILEKKEEKWGLSYPSIREIPPETPNTILFQFESLMISKFIEGGNIDLSYHGLPSNNQVVLTTDRGINHKITFGKVTDGGIYAMKNDNPSLLYVVDPYLAETRLDGLIQEILEKK